MSEEKILKATTHISQNEGLIFEKSSPGKKAYQLPELDVPAVDPKEAFGASEVREELDCGNRRTKDLELRMETTAGVSAASPVPNADWQSIDTHALNSGVFLVACRALGHPITARPGQTG